MYGLTLVSIKLDESEKAVEYIKRAIHIQGENATDHIKYALALAYRNNFDWENAMSAYRPIMKNETTIMRYRDMKEALN